MSALNQKNTAVKVGRKKPSYEGNVQDVQTHELQLYSIIVTSLYGKDSFYETNDDRVRRLRENLAPVVAKNNLNFIANAIVHARSVMNIRSMPIVLTVLFAAELRAQNKQYEHMRQLVSDVIQRADQITDLYAYALQVFGSKKEIPMAIKRGVADSFNKFGEYNLAKYNRAGAVKLRDVLRIVHPKAKSVEQGEIFKKIMEDTLSIPYTWETELSKNGQLSANEQKSKAEMWKELVTSDKMGYMALLRNVRNVLESGADQEVITKLCSRLSDASEVAKSKQLPFRFVNAYDVLKSVTNTGSDKVRRAIGRALDASVRNIPALGQNIWIIVDSSGSMTGGTWGSTPGSIGSSPARTACILAASLLKANSEAMNVRVTFFDSTAKHITGINTDDSVMTITENLLARVRGGATYLHTALDLKNTLGFEPDVVVLLSDMQVAQCYGYSGSRNVDTKKIFKSDTIKIAINLQGYETTPVSEQDGWIQLSGFSERLFDFVPALREKSSIVKLLSVPYMGMSIKSVKWSTAENNSDEE